MSKDPIDAFIDEYVNAIHDHSAAIFAGAGLSIPAGLVNWKDLLRDIAADVGLSVNHENDLVAVAQYHFNEHNRHRINQALITEFANRSERTENHKLLASLPIRTYWTTNYDRLIEQALEDAGKTPDVKTTPENLATTAHRRDAVVYKMHGDVAQPHEAVVTRDDYEQYSQKRQLFSTALQGDLVSKTFYFLGFSFSDPNLNHIMARVRVLLTQNKNSLLPAAACLNSGDFKKRQEFDYASVKQDLQIRDLKRYGLTALLVDSYAEYTNVLRRISQRFRRSRVFIAGSAASYEPWSEAGAQHLIHEISRGLVLEGFSVVCGAGTGVFHHVVNGVLDALARQNTREISERLLLRPFPLNITNEEQRKRRWTEYREQILEEAGIAVFLFGNKRGSDGGVVLADGMEEEFQIAVQQGHAVVPVGCTGTWRSPFTSGSVRIQSNFFPRRGYKDRLLALSKKGTPNEVAAQVVAMVKKLRDEAAS